MSITFVLAVLAAGCGAADTTAAVGAAAIQKKQEAEQGRRTMEEAEAKIKAATEASARRAEREAE